MTSEEIVTSERHRDEAKSHVRIEAYGLTDIGKVRAANEDQFLIADLDDTFSIEQSSLEDEEDTGGARLDCAQGKLLVVADGMGGHAAGQLASSIAVDTVARYAASSLPAFMRDRVEEEEDLEEQLKLALTRCQQSIEAEAEQKTEYAGMGTTLTMAYVLWPKLYVVHAGDSRCYLFRDEQLERLTTDHTVAQELMKQGTLTPEQAESSRFSHVLWNCVGGGTPELSPEVHHTTLEPGDLVMLCSDGLSKYVHDDELARTLNSDATAEAQCRALVQAANDRGGADNITVIVARFVPAG